MNIYFLVVVILTILIITLVFMLLKNENSKPIKKYDNQIKNISFSSIKFPKKIEMMNYSSLSNACKVVFDSYKALAYMNKSANALDKIEWHTWQVSLILSFLKLYDKLFIPYDKDLFHEVILRLSDEQIENEMQKIFRKYINNTNIDKNRDELSKDIIWTAREVSIILYSIMCNKRF